MRTGNDVNRSTSLIVAAFIAATLTTTGCVSSPPSATPPAAGTHAQTTLPPGLDPFANPNPFPSTYQPLPSRPTAITNAHILTAAGPEVASGTVVMSGGRIVAVGADVAPPAGAEVIDAHGRWITPGLIDPH